MSEVVDKPKVPKLRFPEFEGEWADAILGGYCDCLSGFPISGEEILENPEGIRLLRGVNITEGRIRHSNEIDRYFNGDLSGLERFLLREGDVVVGMDGSKVGKNVAVITGDDVGSFLIQRVARLRAIEGNDLNFVYHRITSQHFRNYVDRINTSSGIPHISLKQIREFPIAQPRAEEQRKIAQFLGLVDRHFQLLVRRHEALDVFKKEMMQRLFSQELRFTRDDGSPFPDWKEKRLKEVARRVTEKNTSDIVSFVLTNSAVEGIVSQQTYFDKNIANQENLGGYYVVQENDFVYNPRISVSAPVGPIKRSHFKIGVMSPLYTVFRFRGQNLDFFEQFFASSIWFKYLKTVANYGARHDRMAITTSDFMAMPLPYPHPDEQQKIADFLSVLDGKIDAVARQINAMQRFKKGLLQQMFV